MLIYRAIERNEEETATWKRTRKNRSVFQDYSRYAEIDAYMEAIAAQYPDLVTLINAGKSFEGRDIKYLKFRFWRNTKSANLAVHATCYGVDANRNFDVNFNALGVTSNPCLNLYPGPHPFSEPETRYVRDVLVEYLDRIQIYMDIHSPGNWVLFGYGDRTLPSNAAELFHLGSVMAAAMDAQKLPEAGFYRVGNSATILYVSSGSAQDYGQLVGVPFSYTLGLPDYGHDVLVPLRYVDQINEEAWQGIAVSARVARFFYKMRYNPANVAPTASTTADPTAATSAVPSRP